MPAALDISGAGVSDQPADQPAAQPADPYSRCAAAFLELQRAEAGRVIAEVRAYLIASRTRQDRAGEALGGQSASDAPHGQQHPAGQPAERFRKLRGLSGVGGR